MHWERVVVASVMALTAASAARCGGSVGTDPDRARDASTGSDGPDALAAPTTGDATPNEPDVRPVDAATSDDVQDGASIDAIEAAADALEGGADAGTDGAATATPCEAGVRRCSGSFTEQCSDAGAWVKFGVVACYYGCYGAGICSGAQCPWSCASDDDCASCPQSGNGSIGSYPFCCDKARGVCNSVSVGCSGSTDAGPG